MEVHHHPDVHHKKKKFKEYFLEFLMIFLAVTMGFFAESLRENISKHEKERHLMIMMVEDLKADIPKLDTIIERNTTKISSLDTLRGLIYESIEKKLPDTVTRKMYYIFRLYAANLYGFTPTERTLDQFDKNDAFSLIRKQKISDSILNYREYDGRINDQIRVFDEQYQRRAVECSEKIFDPRILESFLTRDSAEAFLHSDKHFQLLTYDVQTLLIFGSAVFRSRGVLYNYVRLLKGQKQRAKSIAALITKEYELNE
jgi:hypothetical protein